jgi:hypothetical protein
MVTADGMARPYFAVGGPLQAVRSAFPAQYAL